MRHMLALVLTMSLLASCGPVSRAAEASKDAAIDCARENITTAIAQDGPTLIAATVQILANGLDGWQDALGSFGRAVGDRALACAVKSAQAGFEAGRSFAGSAPAERAKSYAKSRGWSFSQ